MNGALLMTINVIHGTPSTRNAPNPFRRLRVFLTRTTTEASHPISRTTTSAAAIQQPHGRIIRSRRVGLLTVAIAAEVIDEVDQRSSSFQRGANCHRSPVSVASMLTT